MGVPLKGKLMSALAFTFRLADFDERTYGRIRRKPCVDKFNKRKMQKKSCKIKGLKNHVWAAKNCIIALQAHFIRISDLW